MKKKKEIEQKSGYEIPERDTVESVVSNDVKTKTFDAVIIEAGKDDYAIVLYKKGFFENKFKMMTNGWDLFKSRFTHPIKIIQTDDRYLLRYPTKRTTNKMSFYRIDAEKAKEIVDKGTIVYD